MRRFTRMTSLAICFGAVVLAACAPKRKPYGEEDRYLMPGTRRMVWAVAPTLNISGEREVDPLLSSDILFNQLQQVEGLTILPVNRVAEIYASLKIEKVQSEQQAYEVCDLLGCDGLVVPTITAYDPYNPPKMGASLQLFLKPGAYKLVPTVDPRELERSATTPSLSPMQSPHHLLQAVGLWDATDGSVRSRVHLFAVGRSDPNTLVNENEMYINMDRYSGFVYHELIAQLLWELPPVKQ